MPSPTPPDNAAAADAGALAAKAMEQQPIEIFAAGTRPCDDGRVFAITKADLQAAAAAYDTTLHEAPLVLGHPDSDSPAWGGVKTLQVDDAGKLSMLAQHIAPAFAEGVRDGRYKKRSACFYEPADPNNPKPGTWYLRHVGFLGAKPPAVKGLRDVRFAQSDTRAVSFSEGDSTAARLWRSLRDFLLADRGADVADQVAPDYLVASLERQAIAEEITDTGAGARGLGPAFSESPPTTPSTKKEDHTMDKDAQLAAEQAQREALQQQNAALQAQLDQMQAGQATARHTSHVAFAEGAMKAGKLLPKDMPELVAVLDAVALAAVAKPVSFSEGTVTKAADPVALIQRLVTAQPKAVSFGEFEAGAGPANVNGGQQRTDAELDQAAKDYAKSKGVSYAEAISAVTSPTFSG